MIYAKQLLENAKKLWKISSFTDNIWDTNLAGLQLVRTYSKGIYGLLCVIDVFTKYTGNITLKKNKNLEKLINDFKVNFTIN